jgi:hypothetical protein
MPGDQPGKHVDGGGVGDGLALADFARRDILHDAGEITDLA